jgi:hypothetical protein
MEARKNEQSSKQFLINQLTIYKMKKPNHQTSDIQEMFTALKPSRKEQAIVWLLSPVIVLATWATLIFICSL